MKAIRVGKFGDPGVMQVAQVPDPTPGPGQVLVALEAAGVNPVDIYIRSGQYGRLPALPYTPGTDGAGRVAALGAGVEGLALGQRVWLSGSATGTYAELAVCAAGEVHPLPDGVDFPQGAALGVPYATAYRALFQRGGAAAGETVLVHGGTGGTGVAAVQFAKWRGLRVLATGGSAEGRAMLEAMGAEVFEHSTPGYEDALRAAAPGGVDLIVEMLANVNLARDLALLAPGGRVAVVGSRGPVEINPREAMLREADIRGVLVFKANNAERAEAVDAIQQGLFSGALRPVAGIQFPLTDAPSAHEAVMSGGHRGKITLRAAF